MTQKTVLNSDVGADICGLHIVENGIIKPEERNDFNTFSDVKKILNTYKQKDYIHSYTNPYSQV